MRWLVFVITLRELIDTGANLVIFSGPKYLCGPTAGLVVGTRNAIAAIRARERASAGL